jgi:hypothetical protein
MSAHTFELIKAAKPQVLMVGGPPFYLGGFKVDEAQLQLGLKNLVGLVETVPVTILEHHALRDESWKQRTKQVYDVAAETGHRVMTAAEFAGDRNNFLESKRRTLYVENPPSKEFEKWMRQGLEKSHTKPPMWQGKTSILCEKSAWDGKGYNWDFESNTGKLWKDSMKMAEEKKTWNSENFDQLMKESHDELLRLRIELQNLLVKFGLRSLKQYQAARNYPLRDNEIARLVKYEIENAIHDVSESDSKDAIIKQAKLEWEKQHKPQ